MYENQQLYTISYFVNLVMCYLYITETCSDLFGLGFQPIKLDPRGEGAHRPACIKCTS